MDLHSAHPYWFVKNGLLTTYPSVSNDLTCQVLIIGGGISGAFVAARLAEAGLDVVVVDAREFGLGSTCSSTALLMYELDDHLLSLREKRGEAAADMAYRVCCETLDNFPAWVEKAGGAGFCGFRTKQSLYLASKERDVSPLREEAIARQAIGIDCRIMEAEEISTRFPFSAPLALLSANAAEADAYRLNHGLLAYAAQLGTRCFDRTHVEKIRENAEGVTARVSGGFQIKADSVVFATGYESQKHLKQTVQDNRSTFALVSEPLEDFDGWWNEVHIWEMARPYLYMRTLPERRIIMGGEDEPFRDPRRRDALIAKKTRALEKRFAKMFPAIPFKTAFCWAGTFAQTNDSLPRIGRTSEWKRALFALGFGGNGITFSSIAAEIIHGELTGHPVPYADLFGFSAGTGNS